VPGGYLVAHVAPPNPEQPQHYDNVGVWTEWIAYYKQLGPTLWQKGE
jgi:hypothetical protein